MKYCPYFYEYLYIDNPDGTICLCPWMVPQKSSIGNILSDEVLVAYNSDHANFLRSTMDDQSFKYCRPEACPHLQNNDLKDITAEEYENRKLKSYQPTEINMAYDFVCNQSCETCRQAVFTPHKNYGEQMQIIGERLSTHLDTATRITASGHGDPFASKYMMQVLENLRPQNPDLSILLETNGVFCDKEHWERIEHLSKFNLEIVITTNSFNPFVYRHISRNGNFEKLMDNLTFVSGLRKANKIIKLTNTLVIQDRNFREIPEFITRSLTDYAFDNVLLRPVYQWGTMDEKVYWFKDVLNPCHPYHQEYLEILDDPSIQDPRVYNFGGNTVHEAREYPSSVGGVTFPYGAIKKDSNIIICGAGQIGREYMRQLNETQYCRVVLWVDKNGKGDCVVTPDRLSSVRSDEFDSVLIATTNTRFAEEMMKTLAYYGVPKEKIIGGC